MALSKLLKETLFLALLLASAYAIANAYYALDASQRGLAVYGAKALFGVVTIALLIAFHAHFSLTKYAHSPLAYYAKKKLHAHAAILSLGMLLLASAFILEFAVYSKAAPLEPYGSFINVMEALSLLCFGYSYYGMARH